MYCGFDEVKERGRKKKEEGNIVCAVMPILAL
jgi:hypothetical protein